MSHTTKHDRALHIRVSEQGHGLVVRRAAEEAGGNVSDMARRMLKFASLNMPKGWNG